MAEHPELPYWLALRRAGLGSTNFALLIAHFGDISGAWTASLDEVRRAGLDAQYLRAFQKARTSDPARELESLAQHGARATTWLDQDFPVSLRDIPQSPPVLFIRGKLEPTFEQAVAVVGTRHVTPYGRQATEYFCEALAVAGVAIISGLARGVDAIAHRVALEHGAPTVAVLAGGIDQVYPRENAGLAGRILETGCLVSEYPVGIPARPDYFPRRNRIISGLAKATLVVEAGEGSGALHTANWAFSQGRDVFAVPGSVFSRQSRATNQLIRENTARLVCTAEQLCEELNLISAGAQLPLSHPAAGDTQATAPTPASTPEEGKFLRWLGEDGAHVDEVTRQSGLGVAEVAGALQVMELRGLVQANCADDLCEGLTHRRTVGHGRYPAGAARSGSEPQPPGREPGLKAERTPLATPTARKTPRKAAGPIERRTPARRPVTARPSGNGTNGTGRKGSKLVIVESPAKARTVENILGPEYRVIASVGHVRDLPNYGYGVEDFEGFKPKYVVVKDKKRGVDKTGVINEIAAAAKDADRVFLSTDPDREGEAISWHIREAAGIPEDKAERVVFHEITKPAIEEAFRHPGKLNMDLVDAQQTRRVLDRLIGFPLTWFVQGKVSKAASAGRVQSVALRLIVEREREILGFNPQEYWTIHARLAKGADEFTADLARIPGQRGKPEIANGELAERLIEAFNRSAFAVSTLKKGERSKSPVPPFTTSTFQQGANNRLGMGAARAMGVAQSLYEGVNLPGLGATGLITYMRTDSLSISPVARGEARRYIAGRWGPEYIPVKERVYRTRTRGAQEAHEAIRPTETARTPESLRSVLDREQLRVYTLIWQRFVASQMADARFTTVSVDIEAKEANELRGVFRASAQHLIFAGHLAVYGADVNDKADNEEDDGEATLPELAEGDALARRSVDGKQHFTEPLPRYTEASLVKALEEKGIGRPSTYATIVQTVQKREYVKKEGRALVPLELGFLVNDLLVKHLDKYVSAGFTGDMEEELDEVAEGERDYQGVVSAFWKGFEPDYLRAKDEAEKLTEETDILCNVCGEANLAIKRGRNGKFFGCPRYPECKNTLPMGPDGEPVYVSAPTQTAYSCPKCGAPTMQKTGPYGPYIECTNHETKTCDFRSGVPVGIACPEEPGTGQLVEKQARAKNRGTFYACWNYPHCSYTTNSIEPGKITPARTPELRAAANAKLLERSARGKASFAKRRSNAGARKAS